MVAKGLALKVLRNSYQHTRELVSTQNTQGQKQRPESPLVTLTWHAEVHPIMFEDLIDFTDTPTEPQHVVYSCPV